MRDYKFRGKRKDNGEWVYGSYINADDCPGEEAEHKIIQTTKNWYEIDPATVGEYTGLPDKNGKEIYEGDILKDTQTGNVKQMEYHGNAFTLVDNNSFFYQIYHADEYEVIGNIHENADLLPAHD